MKARNERGQKPRMVRYADDLVILCHPGGGLGRVSQKFQTMKKPLARWL